MRARGRDRRAAGPAAFPYLSCRQERGGEFFVELEEELHALAVGMEGFGAVTFLHGAIQFGMGLDEFGRHGERVVKVGESAGFMGGRRGDESLTIGILLGFRF